MLPWIIQAAQALAQLESEARVETTRTWIQQTEEKTTASDDDSPYSFLICSLFFLIDKTEVCAQEKQDFYLSQVVAPRLYTTGEGYSIERRALHERFGVNPPITRDWIRSLVTEENKESLRTIPKERRDLIHRGWIDNILFQKQKQTVIPEIFLLDVRTLQSIRSTTRTAAAGCALGLHACKAAKCNPDLLLKDESKGATLVDAMRNRRHSSAEEYEQSVEDAVVSLARNWKDAPLDPQDDDTLRGQTRSVLRGQDAVMQLLDDRMRKLFNELSADSCEHPVPVMRSGLRQAPSAPKESTFVSMARLKFRERGLAFYAVDLAHAAELAAKVSNLSYVLYGEAFLDHMILEALN
jgi:hypothetical protein